MVQEYNLRLLPETASDENLIKDYLVQEKGLDSQSIKTIHILKRNIDARRRTVFINLSVRVYLDEIPENDDTYRYTAYGNVNRRPQVVIVGAGPGGLFAALRLIELGLKPIVVERGWDVHRRKKDLALISRTQQVNPESNYCFGEGGAGACSDGKLYTRSKKRGDTGKILGVLCQHGASGSILIDAHPHIGTDKLPGVISNMRSTILQCGGEVHFGTRMDALIMKEDKVEGIVTAAGQEFTGPVILATGHSARDVYRMLAHGGVEMEQKGIAVGLRLEHPAELIDRIQYHSPHGRGRFLPAAEYSFAMQADGRGVYSFCMCPGGFVVPAASGPEQIVVNGMSPSNRGSKWSNSGMVVEIRPEDLDAPGLQPVGAEAVGARNGEPSLRMMEFQETLERMCWLQGNRSQTAPAQRMADFCEGRLGASLPQCSYAPGVLASPLHFWMPNFITSRLRIGLKHFGRTARGFLTNEALLIGVETRTSAPVRIVRHPDTLQHVRLEGLFPCGEGAGYAGGIVSAAMDGERCAEAAARYVSQF